MRVKGQKFLVVGLGKTGVAVSGFLARAGADVTATDLRDAGEITEAADLEKLGVKLRTGGHREDVFTQARTVVLSPGVPPDIEPVRAARRADARVIGEVELSSALCGLPVVAVTGSNGKTTTTGLIGHILKACGKKPFVGGNFGDPFINAVGNESAYDLALLEMSSFQLKTTFAFKPAVAVLLNISPNHLDVHPDYEDYALSKKKIFANQTQDDWAVANGADTQVAAMLDNLSAKKVLFNSELTGEHPGCATSDGQTVFFRGEKYDLSGSKLQGRHNMENSMAAIAVASILGCEPEKTAAAVIEFSPPPHRMEFVSDVRGARVYDDSKSTNPAAAAAALTALDKPVVLISGGKDKKTGFSALREPVRSKVSSLVLFGEARRAMMSELGTLTKTFAADSLQNAVEIAVSEARPGGSILFSPACSSFDMFSSFEERGREFKKIVKRFG
ncbi:MAG: UDP-N-acetylmuramoyl-L-alanine--D-glutamate ligase [Candidatus Mycalebacterium zealandia]|nr:MAG: UDP-N-acetylmuramoyl-L-alanine--D-glutamate ligase [Candidatus Mycalebacterium zealandia]